MVLPYSNVGERDPKGVVTSYPYEVASVPTVTVITVLPTAAEDAAAVKLMISQILQLYNWSHRFAQILWLLQREFCFRSVCFRHR